MLTFADMARRLAVGNIRKFAGALDRADKKNKRLREELERERDRRFAAEGALSDANARAEARLDVVRRAVELAPSGVIERALDNVLEDIEAIVAEKR
jgi:hypothetical protein